MKKIVIILGLLWWGVGMTQAQIYLITDGSIYGARMRSVNSNRISTPIDRGIVPIGDNGFLQEATLETIQIGSTSRDLGRLSTMELIASQLEGMCLADIEAQREAEELERELRQIQKVIAPPHKAPIGDVPVILMLAMIVTYCSRSQLRRVWSWAKEKK